MTSTLPLSLRIELLLNTLTGERYARRSLVSELTDSLALTEGMPDAVQAGRALLEGLEAGIDESEYERRIAAIIALTRTNVASAGYSDAAE